MADPRRGSLVTELLRRLPGATAVWDRQRHVWDTFRRCLRAAGDATHLLVVQDDAVVCPDLVGKVRSAIEHSGEHPIGLYLPGNRFSRQVLGRVVSRAQLRRVPWIEMPGPWWGVGTVFPADHIPGLLEWCAEGGPLGLDYRIAGWYEREGIPCWYTVPCLVGHRHVDENPSLADPTRTGNRPALLLAGKESLNWRRAPLRAMTPPDYPRGL